MYVDVLNPEAAPATISLGTRDVSSLLPGAVLTWALVCSLVCVLLSTADEFV